MCSFEFDIVKAEKADAMRRYKRERYFVICLRFVAALVLFFWSFAAFPSILDVAANHVSSLSNHFRVFLLINAILFFVYYTSTSATASSLNNRKNVAVLQPDIYDEYVSVTASSSARRSRTAAATDGEKQLVVSSPPVISSEEVEEDGFYDKQIVCCENTSSGPVQAISWEEVEEDGFYDKQIVCCENASSGPVPEENPVRDLTVTTRCYSVENDDKRYTRTQSERYARENRKKERELQRSATENGREARKSMQDMNSEEFRLAIESFIATKKKVLREENMELSTKETTEYMHITSI